MSRQIWVRAANQTCRIRRVISASVKPRSIFWGGNDGVNYHDVQLVIGSALMAGKRPLFKSSLGVYLPEQATVGYIITQLGVLEEGTSITKDPNLFIRMYLFLAAMHQLMYKVNEKRNGRDTLPDSQGDH